jgi:hypothetical protein
MSASIELCASPQYLWETPEAAQLQVKDEPRSLWEPPEVTTAAKSECQPAYEQPTQRVRCRRQLRRLPQHSISDAAQ